MRHIVAYDIKDKTRLKKISQICLDYGIRIQYSVFEFDLSLEVAAEFLQEVTGIIDSAADKILVIPVCENCRKSIKQLGMATNYGMPELFLF